MARQKDFDPQERLIRARNLFWRKGYHATSLEDLVKEMGLNRSSIYDTYGDKRQLFLSCLRNYLDFVATENLDAVALAQSPFEALENVIHATISRTLKSGSCSMGVKSSFELALSDPAVQDLIRGAAERNISLLTRLLSAAQESKEIPQMLPPFDLAKLFQATLSGIDQDYSIYQDDNKLREIGTQLLSLLALK